MPRLLTDLPRRLFLVVMLVGSALITAASLEYFDFSRLPGFAIEKFPVRHVREWLWLASLRVHVASALVSFPLCLLLITRWLQRRPVWHRWIGRATGGLVLLALVPSGSVLSFDAKGGWFVSVGFLLSAVIAAGAMVSGVAAARRRDFVLHRRAMRHVVAQMIVAVSSRVMLLGFDFVGMEPGVSYVIALWVPVLVSAGVAEWISSGSSIIERISRELSALALVPVRRVVRSVSRRSR
jgi:uncharacterized membrane protein YozB (DUF420 family)